LGNEIDEPQVLVNDPGQSIGLRLLSKHSVTVAIFLLVQSSVGW
jgi:hypothetical protein